MISSSWKQYSAVFTCTLTVMAAGTSLTWTEPLMSDMLELYSLDPSGVSWAVAFVEVGEILFCIPAGILADRFGRKWTLLSTGPIALLGWLLLAASRSPVALYAARFLQGVNFATVFGVVPLYIAETADPAVRGRLSGQFQTMWCAGMLWTYLTGPYLSLPAYLSACGLISVLFTAFFPLMPETPFYYFMTGREEEARSALSWLRGSSFSQSELEQIKESVRIDMENKASWSSLFATSRDRKIFATVIVICIIKYLGGAPVIPIYAADAFARGSNGTLGKHESSIVYGALLLFSAVFGSFLSDAIGRKMLLILTCAIVGMCYCATAICFFLMEETSVDLSGLDWLTLVTISLGGVVNNIGPSALMQTLQGEMFPSNTRAAGNALVGVTASVLTFVDLKQYQTVVDLFGSVYPNFVIFAFFSFLGSAFVLIAVKETAGKSLGEIQSAMECKNEEENRSNTNAYKMETTLTNTSP